MQSCFYYPTKLSFLINFLIHNNLNINSNVTLFEGKAGWLLRDKILLVVRSNMVTVEYTFLWQ